ncbi:MAG TPA: GNAT family protein [Hyphomicrobiales bacterium]|nr:GNAT family N-acetyltransferase [Rhodobiaceae bacterium]HXK53212.1 GNAT family protein [Hyphomicrobiales bacterium]
MAFLRNVTPLDTGPAIYGRGLYLRTPRARDYSAWALLREKSRGFLVPWEPVWPADDLTRAAYRRRLKRYYRDIRNDEAYAFFIFCSDDNQLAGGLTLSHVRRGVTQSCSLGYWIGAPFARKGLMTEAVRSIIPFVFETLHLHRIEAACLPDNAASIRLLEKTGFSREGQARRYLRINGVWQDHLLFALLEDDPRQAAGLPR